MPGWGIVAAIVLGVPALYGLHRLALRLEDAGHLYYLRRKPTGSAAGSFVAMQRIVEPKASHVLVIRESKPVDGRDAAPE